MHFKITATFDNTESAQSAGRRILQLQEIKDVRWQDDPIATNVHADTDKTGRIIYGSSVTAERGFLTSTGKLSVTPMFENNTECRMSVTAGRETVEQARGIIFNSGGYDVSVSSTHQ